MITYDSPNNDILEAWDNGTLHVTCGSLIHLKVWRLLIERENAPRYRALAVPNAFTDLILNHYYQEHGNGD